MAFPFSSALTLCAAITGLLTLTASAQEFAILDPTTQREIGQIHLGLENTAEIGGKKYLLKPRVARAALSERKAEGIQVGPIHVHDLGFQAYLDLLRKRSQQKDPVRKKDPQTAGVNIVAAIPPDNPLWSTAKVSFDLEDASLLTALRYFALAAHCQLTFADAFVQLTPEAPVPTNAGTLDLTDSLTSPSPAP